MALTFPVTPTDGQIVIDADTGRRWQYSIELDAWRMMPETIASASGIALEDLIDTYVTGARDGDVLMWDGRRNRWSATALPGSCGHHHHHGHHGAHSIEDLEDVTLVGIQGGQGLAWNAARRMFEPAAIGGGSPLPAGTAVGQVATWNGAVWAAQAPGSSLPPGTTPGHVATWNGTAWVGQAQTAALPTATAAGQVVTWNGTAWVAQAPAADIVTTLAWNAVTRTLTYTDEAGTATAIVVGETVTTMAWNAGTRTLTYNNEAGVAQTANIAETLTVLSKQDLQTLKYTDEAGTNVLLPLPQGIEVVSTVPTTGNYDNRIIHIEYGNTYRYVTAISSWVQM